jgi:hypothetical protein
MTASSSVHTSGTSCIALWSFAATYNGPHSVRQSCGGVVTTYTVAIVTNSSTAGSARPSVMTWTAAAGSVLTFSTGCGGSSSNVTGLAGLWLNGAQACVAVAANA